MALLKIVIIYSLLSCLHGHDQENLIAIEEHPLSLLVPVNETAIFSCKAKCESGCLVLWGINGNMYQYDPSEIQQNGFTFSLDKDNGSIIMNVTVNATEAINNTDIYCVFEKDGDNVLLSVRSKNATLLVITGSPILHNPSIEKNSTHLSLIWSPPFLWPGQRIQSYNISFVNKTDGSIDYCPVSTTFNDQVVRFSRKIYQNEKCASASTEIEFRILAVGISGPLPTHFNVTEWIHPSDTYCRTEAVTSPSTTSETLSYKVAFGISLSAATILLLVLLILFVCVMRLCSRRFNGIACNENDTKAKAYNNMVHNPIYAGLSGGPVYDSIWPLVDTVGKSYTSTRLSTDGFPTAADTTALQERAAGGEYRPSKAGYNESRLW